MWCGEQTVRRTARYGRRVRALTILPMTESEQTMKTVTTLIAIAMLAMLAACNTVEGAGKDVKATGAAVEKAADNSKPK
jgi:entericidin B